MWITVFVCSVMWARLAQVRIQEASPNMTLAVKRGVKLQAAFVLEFMKVLKVKW